MLSLGNKARNDFNDVVRNTSRSEVNAYAKSSTNYPKFDGFDSIKQFSMEDMLQETQKGIPTFSAALTGAMGAKRKLTEKQAKK